MTAGQPPRGGHLGPAAPAVGAATGPPDVTTAVTLYLGLLFLLSARLVLPGLGGFGTPANVLGLVLFATVLGTAVVPGARTTAGPQPIRTALVVYLLWFGVSYAIGNLRPATEIAVAAGDRDVLGLLALTGIALVIADGVTSRARLEVLLERFVLLAAVMGLIGIVQFATPVDPVDYLRLPGLIENREITTAGSRAIFQRPYSTALHPIEFGAVLALALPLAVHFALRSPSTPANLLRHGAPLVCIAVAIPISLSRSAILGLLAGIGILSLQWDWRRRLNVGVAAAAALVALTLAVPGLFGTFRGLFTNVGEDPSIQARLADVGQVKAILSEHPVTGLGPGVFNPADYFILDNQYYGTAVSTGLPGLATLLLVLAVGVVVAARIAHRSCDPGLRGLGYALTAGIVVASLAMATFDGFAFTIFSGSLFLLLGAAGALWRLAPAARSVRSSRLAARLPDTA